MYIEIVENFKKQLLQGGYGQEQIHSAFGAAREKDLKLIKDLYGTFSYWSNVYFEEDGELDDLKAYKTPQKVLDFYNSYEPKQLPCLEGKVYLLDLKGILKYNAELAPGSYLINYGLLTFAVTVGGSLICMDLNELNGDEPRIVFAEYDWFSFNDVQRKVQYSFYPFIIPEGGGLLTREIIRKYLPEIELTFSGFLKKLSLGEYKDMEIFFNRVGKRSYDQ